MNKNMEPLNESEMTVILKKCYFENEINKEVLTHKWQSMDSILKNTKSTTVLVKLNNEEIITVIIKQTDSLSRKYFTKLNDDISLNKDECIGWRSMSDL